MEQKKICNDHSKLGIKTVAPQHDCMKLPPELMTGPVRHHGSKLCCWRVFLEGIIFVAAETHEFFVDLTILIHSGLAWWSCFSCMP
jgi:hypothetical protein